jgi:general secretion pathway protein C
VKRTAKRNLRMMLLALAAFIAPRPAAAGSEQLLVLGVIASAHAENGVALFKNQVNGRTFAVRVGQEVDAGIVVRRVTREQVYLDVHGQIVQIRVGEETGTEPVTMVQAPVPAASRALPRGVVRQGNTVRLTQAYRDQVLKHDLSKVLMQAAAVPVYANGELQGFRLLDIEPGSIYELAGLQNGDIVTAINSQPLTDVGRTIKLLQSLRDEAKADVTVQRAERPVTLQLVID